MHFTGKISRARRLCSFIHHNQIILSRILLAVGSQARNGFGDNLLIRGPPTAKTRTGLLLGSLYDHSPVTRRPCRNKHYIFRQRVAMDEPSATVEVPRTSDIPFFSSLHGRQRRAQRGIDRRDLQAAVKHGKRERAKRDPRTGDQRWRYTYKNVVYITDSTSTREITSWVSSTQLLLPCAELTLKQIGEHQAAKERLRKHPSASTSHTVIVVDQSGSMRTSDVSNFPNRSRAVFGMLALEFVAKQRVSGEMTDTDVVSLVLMQDYATIALEREPMGLVLYNQLVGLYDAATPQRNGNFLPALDEAKRLLIRHTHGGCALSLLFLSDGRPSDYTAYLGAGNYREAARIITSHVHALAKVFEHQLSVSTIGFGGPGQDFSVLEAMAEAARDGGAQGEFHRPSLSSEGLGSAIADSISSLTATKLSLTTLVSEGKQPRALRQVEREAAGSHWGHAPTTMQTGDGWVVYTEGVERFEFSQKADRFRGNPWIAVDLASEQANGIAIRSKALGEGAERLVFGLQVCYKKNTSYILSHGKHSNPPTFDTRLLLYAVGMRSSQWQK